MLKYLAQRVVSMVPVVFGITALVFVLIRVVSDPIDLLLPPEATQVEVADMRERLGLDRPIQEQYLRYMGGLVRGDFGASLRYAGQPALKLVLERLPATLELTFSALLVAILLSIPLGIIAALNRNRIADGLSTGIATLGQAVPSFWLGIMLVLFLSVELRLLPVSGRGDWKHLVIPAITLGSSLAAVLTRMMRSSLLEVLGRDYVRTAHAKGLRPRAVVLKHAIRNALLAYVTLIGVQIASLMAGAVVIEQVFAWPGTGQLAIQAIQSGDMAVVQAVVIVVSLVVMVANLAVDVSYALIDPRVQYA